MAQCTWLMTRCARLANGRPPCQQTLKVLLRWNKRFRAHNCCGAKDQPSAILTVTHSHTRPTPRSPSQRYPVKTVFPALFYFHFVSEQFSAARQPLPQVVSRVCATPSRSKRLSLPRYLYNSRPTLSLSTAPHFQRSLLSSSTPESYNRFNHHLFPSEFSSFEYLP
jgi:hypothetical protein